ncbi:hypothetical protein [Arsenicicoccus dermatophilus]|uniref:hypothetical protein n=1 Tax=Arsenicicoccus dermatophilus TaxID=1076331 RepID=UPI0039174604
MDISLESVHVGGRKLGALVRRRTATDLGSLTVLRDDAGLHLARLALDHPGDVRAWTSFTFCSADGTVTVIRPTPTTLQVDGRSWTVPADTVPSHAGPVLLAEMLAGCHTEAELHELRESDPSAPPVAAHFSVGNPEEVDLPGVGPRSLGSVTLYRDDVPADRYWFDDREVLAGVRQGARSYHVASLEELLDGLDPEVVAAVRHFLA